MQGGEDSYIENVRTGNKVKLLPKGRGSYIMRVRLADGSDEDVVVDSGAEESVCPWGFGERVYGTQKSEKSIAFRSAGGGYIDHYGQRTLRVSPF